MAVVENQWNPQQHSPGTCRSKSLESSSWWTMSVISCKSSSPCGYASDRKEVVVKRRGREWKGTEIFLFFGGKREK